MIAPLARRIEESNHAITVFMAEQSRPVLRCAQAVTCTQPLMAVAAEDNLCVISR